MDKNLQQPNPDNHAPRKRGAPKGNFNALKHGIYSERFRSGELDALVEIPKGNIQNEIAILRVMTRRVAAMMEEGASPEDVLNFYNLVGMMCMRISTLLRTEKLLEIEKEDGGMLNTIREHADYLLQMKDKNAWLFADEQRFRVEADGSRT
jgi:hypothetical protein